MRGHPGTEPCDGTHFSLPAIQEWGRGRAFALANSYESRTALAISRRAGNCRLAAFRRKSDFLRDASFAPVICLSARVIKAIPSLKQINSGDCET
jgi:hypothetical protein